MDEALVQEEKRYRNGMNLRLSRSATTVNRVLKCYCWQYTKGTTNTNPRSGRHWQQPESTDGNPMPDVLLRRKLALLLLISLGKVIYFNKLPHLLWA
jgi:hypothetical protein